MLHGIGLDHSRGIRVHRERHRIASEYFRGTPVPDPDLDLLHQMDGGSRAEFGWSMLIAAGVIAVSVGSRSMFHQEATIQSLVVVIVGSGLGGLGLAGVQRSTPPLLR
ncbi:hypothetical protein DDP54_13415 [Cellulomonas sp. WB94]|uniref:hypothetical protein n=1 Tax=Cellulomonas sp. WB94 TaxID=2173174 RepID=UPI000D57722D|nr:hypothetical protein [Cellulomonas sp. WB94]PVU83821.1 hypothetical protein DDP54_13415 [Cellulomonas sp. WB94]